MHPLSSFGPGVIGEEAAAYFAKQTKEERNVFGPGVVGEETATAEAVEAPKGKALDLSVAEMDKQLEANPALFEEFFLGELARPLPRKAAMRVLLAFQKAQLTPVAEIVEILEARLAPPVSA